MSLQVWLPLNGNLNNNGTINTTVSGGVDNSNGKIGSCRAVSSSNYLNIAYSIPTTSEFTLSFWMKVPSSMGGGTSWEQMLAFNAINSTSGSVSSTGINWASYHNVKIYDDSYHQWLWAAPGSQFSYDTWHRWTITHTAYSNGVEAKVYIGYNLIGTYRNAEQPLKICSGNCVIGNGIISGPLYINDFRIYDTCLSAAEVKDLDRGLIIHYSLADPYMEATTNTMTAINNSLHNAAIGTCSLWNNQDGGTQEVVNFQGRKCFKFTYAGSSSNRYYVTLPNPTVKATYSCKIWADGPVAGCLHIERNPNYKWAGGTTSYTGTRQWQTVSLTLDNAYSGETCYFFIYGSAGRVVYACDFQVETTDHVTPYTPGNRGSSCPDMSGYRNNGTIVTAPKVLTGNTPRYSACSKFDGSSSYIKLPAININMSDITVSIWTNWIAFQNWSRSFDISSAANGAGATVGIANSGTGANITVFGRVPGGSFPDTVVCATSANTWYHIVVTISGTAVKVYVNGSLKTSATTTGTSGYQTLNYAYIAKSAWSDDALFNGYDSDFRIYSTALSAQDVLDLYNSPARVAKSGALITNGEVIE